MNLLLVNIVLAFIWAALTGQFDPRNLFLGFALGYLILWISRRAFRVSSYFTQVPHVLGFFLFFLLELIVANIRVAYRIISPINRLKPRVIAVPLDTCNEIEITFLANLISLTPGTLSLDASEDRCVLYVHTMYAPDPESVRKSIKEGYEQRIFRLTRGVALPKEGENAS